MPGSAFTDVVVPASMAVLMVGVGTTLRPDDFTRELRRPRGLAAGLLAQLVALPLVALGTAALLRPAPPLALGLVLLAACPGGVFSNLMAHLARGRVALSVVLTATSTTLGLVTIPLWVGLAAAVTGLDAGTLDLSASLPRLAAMTTVPVLLGVGLRATAPRLCDRLERPFGVASGLFLIAVATFIAVGRGAPLLHALADVGPSAGALSALSSLAGAGIAVAFGLDRPGVVTVGLETGIQNAGLAAAIALSAFPAPIAGDVALPALLYLLLTFLPAAGWIAAGRRWATAGQTAG